MKKQIISRVIRPLKPFLGRTLWPEGSTRTVLAGPCKGLRYRIFPDMGLSPIYGGWEEEAQAVILENVAPGAVVYDLGANYGIHALLFARLVEDSGHVFAFEPLPTIHAALQSNIELNKFSNVTCVKLAVSEKSGSMDFVTGHHVGAGHLSTAGDAQGEQLAVETISLDEFVFEQHHRPPNFIKIDIEGAEGRALAGAERVLTEHRPVLLVDLHNPEQDVAVGTILLKCGYRAYRTEDRSEVKDLSSGWPDPDGLSGQVIAFPRLVEAA